MGTQPTAGLTYADLLAFPEDNFRREIIDGELIVTAAPSTRHQRVVANLTIALGNYAAQHGGEVFPAPTDVFLTDRNVVEPDVIFVRAENLGQVEDRFVRSAPDIVVEVSSPSTRRLELVRKRELYERFGVPEYWYVNLESDRVEIYRFVGEAYGRPDVLERGERVISALVPGFEVAVEELLGPSPRG